MDFKGQQLAELVYTYVLNFGALVALGVGFVMQSFTVMMSIYSGACALALALCVPDWPMYNKNKLTWLPPLKPAAAAAAASAGEQKRGESAAADTTAPVE